MLVSGIGKAMGDLQTCPPLDWGTKTHVMGVINVSPDSFSGDGLGDNPDAIVKQAIAFQEAGATIIDVGGESTRPPGLYPGSKRISVEVELQRVVPIVRLLRSELDIPISIDTYKSQVAEAAVSEGASIINDIWGLKFDPMIANVAAKSDAYIVLMHNKDEARYKDLIPEMKLSLKESIDKALKAGVSSKKIILDPGIGFGKTAEHNLEILRHLDEFSSLGKPILVGSSRKSTIGLVLKLPVDDRLEGSAATVALAISKGADIVRVHDVKAMARVAKMSDAIVRGWNRTSADN